MELTHTLSMAFAFALVIIVLRSYVFFRCGSRKALNLPPGPRGWPVLGSLGALAGAIPPHRALAALAARHGPLMHLRLGSYHAVVASSADTARLVLKTHDLVFADRPRTTAGEHAAYGYRGIVHTPYGAYWRMARRLCATELFSTRRVDSYEYIRTQELRALMRGLFERAGRAVEVREHLADAALRNVLRMAVGGKWSGCYGSGDGEAFRRTLDEAFTVTGAVSNVSEWVPWLGWLDVQGCVRSMKRLSKVYDRFLERILDDHDEERRRQREATTYTAAAKPAAASKDLVDVLLQLSEEEDETVGTSASEARLTRDGVKAFIQDIIAGGTESSAVTMEWALSELLRRPDAAAAVTEELDRVVGRGRWVEERDLEHLPYIDAVVKETMRLHPVGPLLVPHMAREHTVVAGYDIPAGARVLVNVWAIARDPASWPDRPDEFRPERFIGSAVDVRGQHFELLPFGAGRRICPAHGLAMKVVGAGLANLLHGFAWRLPDGVSPEDVSMEELFGLSTRRKVPLVALPEPRLPAHLYAADD
ncbi:trimethyltridecatetraene synthase-like [Lolium rigidum]|uniref:trimethyltridecatetraene synthase-like n=1 Tax=Lolium rigidum TaxID=89674 RepID=UPI001F5C1210|nr:trimethyltridecatetraene synthase-like [Lolium rigidum]